MNKIYIITGKIRSGKTSTLAHLWEQNKTLFDGFITPDINEKRKLVFLDNNNCIDLEVDESMKNDSISIGKFHFSKIAFNQAKEKINSLILSTKKWIIIDEIGKLELAGEGLEPEIGRFIEQFKSSNNNSNLIIVIRDYLLSEASKKYQLEEAIIIDKQVAKNLLL